MSEVKTIKLARTGSQYSDEQKRQVVLDWCIKGNAALVARENNIPERTVQDWLTSDWGIELSTAIRAHNSEEFIVKAQQVIDKAVERTLETVGEADCRTAATVGAIYYDKLRLALNQPSVIHSDSKQTLMELAQAFREISLNRSTRPIIEATVIDDD